MTPFLSVLAALLLLAAPVAATTPVGCSDGSCFPGGGKAATDCFAELADVHPNSPFPVPGAAKQKPKKEQRCFDGDAGCDLDGEVNGVCRFPVDVCLFNADPNLAACSPAQVTAVKAKAPGSADGGASLQTAIDALLPAGASACTDDVTVEVPLKTTGSGKQKPRRVSVSVKATTTAGKDPDKLGLVCLPRLWPQGTYDHYNRRATTRTTIAPGNVAGLQMKWQFDTSATVSSTPTVGDKLVYATSWDGVVYALDRKKGSLVWSYDTQAPGPFQSGATLTPDGRLLVGDPEAQVHCLDARTGALLWKRSVEIVPQDQIWGSPAVVNNRVLVPIASNNDAPCTKGRAVALDLDTGEPLWTARTAPDRVCEDDTTVGCTLDDDCASGRCVGMCAGDRHTACVEDVECGSDGPCEDAIGGGVTATPGTDVTGETVFMASVGCYTGPRIGNSDRIFRLRASDGFIEWAVPDFPGESFGRPLDQNYNDYGFLNGPIVVNGATPALIAASKDGNIYARDPLTGAELWTKQVGDVTQAPDAFAAFGLFNGAPAYASGRIFTSLYRFNDIGDGNPLPAGIVHSQCFDAADGEHVWDASIDIDPTFGHVTEAGGVVFMGSSDFLVAPLGEPAFFAFDAATGAHLATFSLPTETPSGPSVVDGDLYIGFGNFVAAGGVVAYELP